MIEMISRGAAGVVLAAALAATPALDAQNCSSAPLNLQILHSSDNESSFLDPNTLEPKALHYSALYEGLTVLAEREGMASIHVTAGDHTLPGPFYLAAEEVPELGAPGLGDIAIYNAMNLAANGMGNHEFDGGINDTARMIDFANYPWVAANLNFANVMLESGVPPIQIGADAASSVDNSGKVVRSTILQVGDDCVGFVGRAPADFFNVISDPPNTIPGLDFYGGRGEGNQPNISAITQVLEQVDELKEKGVNKIILIDHAQDFTGDPLSANRLRDIDVIVAAGSTGFMARPEAMGPFNLLRPEDAPSADYPTVREDSDGSTVLVVNSEQLYRYIGNLMISFDAAGKLTAVDPRSGPIATTEEGVAALGTLLGRTLTPNQEVADTIESLRQTDMIQGLFGEVGVTTRPINGLRSDVRTRETNGGRLAADSTLWAARQQFPELEVDVALKNGGGVRDTIVGPSIIRLTINTQLAFDNQLGILRLTGRQMIAAMENSVSRIPSADGRFPHIAGMEMDVDASMPGLQGEEELNVASRVRRLVIRRFDGSLDVLILNGMPQGDLDRTFVMATNDFLSTGGDGYAAFAVAEKLAVTEIGEQQILADYISEELEGSVDVLDPPQPSRFNRLDLACQLRNTSPTVVVRGCDSGVRNEQVELGCTVSDVIANECRGVSGNPLLYGPCIRRELEELELGEELISPIESCAIRGPKR